MSSEQPMERHGDEAEIKAWMRQNWRVSEGAFDRADLVDSALEAFALSSTELETVWAWAAEVEREVFPPNYLRARRSELASLQAWMEVHVGADGHAAAARDLLVELEIRIQKLEKFIEVDNGALPTTQAD